MAVDKLVDSTQLDADLTSIANAIRTKGGTSAQMAFPAGFVSAVQAIPTGGVTPTGTKQISITQNGVTTEDVTNYASAEITVNVPTGGSVTQDADGYIILPANGGSSGAIALLNTVEVTEQVRAVNIDISEYSSLYDFLYIFADVELTASDWIYYVINGSSPSGGTYQNSMQIHKGICFVQLHPSAGNPSSSVIAGVAGASTMSIGNQNGTPVSNVYAYTYVATKYFKAGSKFKIYGGNYADM